MGELKGRSLRKEKQTAKVISVFSTKKIQIKIRLEREENSIHFAVAGRIFRSSQCVACSWVTAASQGSVKQ